MQILQLYTGLKTSCNLNTFSVIIMKGIKINSETRRLVYIERLFCSLDL